MPVPALTALPPEEDGQVVRLRRRTPEEVVLYFVQKIVALEMEAALARKGGMGSLLERKETWLYRP